MAPSPKPIITCQNSMAGMVTMTPPASEKAGEMPISTAAAREPTTTDNHDAVKTDEANHRVLLDFRVSSFTMKKLREPITAMLNMLAPNAIMPPSAKKNACINRTMVILSIAAQGPKRTARKVPPTRCPLVPYTIGKFIIWAAKTKALEIASMATKDCGYSDLTFFHDHARNAIDTANIVTAVAGLMNPSGMCT